MTVGAGDSDPFSLMTNVHFPDDSPQAHAIRARLAAGDNAFVHDTGNGLTVADPPITTANTQELRHA